MIFPVKEGVDINRDSLYRSYTRTGELKKVKELCKEFGFTASMLKGELAEGREKQKVSAK